MIKGIRVLPRMVVSNLIFDGNVVFNSKKWHLISIYTKANEELLTFKNKEVLNKLNCIETLSLLFSDITQKHYVNYYEELKKKGTDALFSEKQAYEIINFLNKIKDRPGEEYLVIHCDMGVSRSGAVGVFANEYLQLDYSRFKRNNSNIQPNTYVLSVLRKISGLGITEENSAFNMLI